MYTGWWYNGRQHGSGEIKSELGEIVKGEWKDGIKIMWL